MSADKPQPKKFYVIGNGSRLGMDEPGAATDKLVHAIEANVRDDVWPVVFYGGDACDPTAPDIGYVVACAKERCPQIRVIAVQTASYAQGCREMKHIDAVFEYPDVRGPDGKLIFGGYTSSAAAEMTPVAATRWMMNTENVDKFETIAFGGGPIARQECHLLSSLAAPTCEVVTIHTCPPKRQWRTADCPVYRAHV